METTDSTALRTDFLQLLVAQVQNQDPLEPIGQQEFTEQLASFSTLEGVEKLNANFESLLRLSELSQGTQLIGKVASYSLDDPSQQGIVRAVRVEGGEVKLDVDGVSVSLDEVLELRAPDAA